MMLKIRPFNPTNREYETLVEIMNRHNPHRNFTADDWREFDQVIVSKGTYARFVGEVDGQIVAVSSYGQPPRLRGTAKYLLELALRPEYEREALVERLYGHLMDILESRNAIAVLTETDENNLDRIHFLAEKRFELVQRDYYSRLELATFDLTPHLSVMKKMQDHHINIYNLAYLQAHDPDWFSKLEALHWQVRQDIPSSEPPVRESTDQYRKRFERSSFRADFSRRWQINELALFGSVVRDDFGRKGTIESSLCLR